MIEYTVHWWPDGSKQWYLNGQLHCEGGPAIEGSDGSKEWRLNGQLHREDGPAIEGSDGSKEWWLNGQLHCEGGPAYEGSDGSKSWWLNGRELTEEEHRQQTRPQLTLDQNTVDIDGKTYILTLKE